ncbi:hypothetical protein [Paenibacillus dauci]|uniref:hypothetical protein n=1 Tax=Paenibacillus dauci TaxID=1567106 RepID=UPI00061A07B4|nr:hypothetical protein [Paenibacillus dauci]
MAYRPTITTLRKAGINEKEGLYEFTATLADGTECRMFYNRFPEWKMTNINRLLTKPCPICRKDFICNCFNAFAGEIDQQIKDRQLIDEALAN